MPPIRYQEQAFPPESRLDWKALVPLLGPAAAAMARYDGALEAVPNPRVLLSPLTTQEAVLSSRIEGSQATMAEVLESEAGGQAASPERRGDIAEVLNYRVAMQEAEQMMQELPLCQRVIRSAHKTLLTGVRGQGKSPGRYRRIPNWIGPPGCTEEDATFVPIGAEKLPAAMDAWERYIHCDAPDRLVQAAVVHAEFEALHPFLDGNGRLGRMLIPLFLWSIALIKQPTFYVSTYFEAEREAYYERLLAVSRDDDWTGWCCFFLEAIRTQAERNLSRVNQILSLYDTMKDRVAQATRSRYASRTLDWIFERPFFNTSQFVSLSGIPNRTAWRLLNALQGAGILRVVRSGNGRRGAILASPDLLNTAEGKAIF